MRYLFLDDDQQRHDTFAKMSIGHIVHHVYTAQEAIDVLKRECFDIIFLDHDLGGHTFVESDGPEETGYTVAKWMVEHQQAFERQTVFIHSFNPAGTQNICEAFRHTDFRYIKAPFGTFKIEAPTT